MKALLVAALVLLAALAAVPAADADPLPDVECMPVYTRVDVENLAIVRPSSCTVALYWCPYQGAPLSECDHLIQ